MTGLSLKDPANLLGGGHCAAQTSASLCKNIQHEESEEAKMSLGSVSSWWGRKGPVEGNDSHSCSQEATRMPVPEASLPYGLLLHTDPSLCYGNPPHSKSLRTVVNPF